MKKINKLLCFILLIICAITQVIHIPQVYAAEEALTVLFTHDMHSNFESVKYEEAGHIGYIGGYARLMSAINAQKELDKDALLLDAGDFSMGSVYQTIFMSTAPELRIMGRMGYDAVTFGNHDFDYRADGLADCLNAAKESNDPLPQIVQSNMSFPVDKEGNLTASLSKLMKAADNYGVKDYTIFEKKGIRIGVFGIMGAESADMAPMSEVVFDDQIKNAKRVVSILKEQEKVDLIICLSHSGTNNNDKVSEDETLAAKVSGIDLIISGHTHTKYSTPLIVGNTIICSAENDGRNLGVIKVARQSDNSWKPDKYELVPINDKLPEDEDIADGVKEFRAAVEDEYFSRFGLGLDEIIANAPYSLSSKDYMVDNHEDSNLGNIIGDAFIYSVMLAEGEDYIPIDAAVVPAGTIRASFTQGNILTSDVFSVSSLGIGKDRLPGYPLISVYLTGKELKTLCEVDASVTPIMEDAQLFISGIRYAFNPNRLIFNKVTDSYLQRNRGTLWNNNDDIMELIDNDRLYRIVAGLYSAQMLSVVGEKTYGLLKLVPKTKDGTPVTDFEDQIIYDSRFGDNREVKEWYAVVSYLQSFPEKNGIPTIPDYYYETHARKHVDNDKNISAILAKPNWIALTVYCIILVLIIVLIVVVIVVVKKIRRKRRKS